MSRKNSIGESNRTQGRKGARAQRRIFLRVFAPSRLCVLPGPPALRLGGSLRGRGGSLGFLMLSLGTGLAGASLKDLSALGSSVAFTHGADSNVKRGNLWTRPATSFRSPTPRSKSECSKTPLWPWWRGRRHLRTRHRSGLPVPRRTHRSRRGKSGLRRAHRRATVPSRHL